MSRIPRLTVQFNPATQECSYRLTVPTSLDLALLGIQSGNLWKGLLFETYLHQGSSWLAISLRAKFVEILDFIIDETRYDYRNKVECALRNQQERNGMGDGFAETAVTMFGAQDYLTATELMRKLQSLRVPGEYETLNHDGAG